MLPISNPTSDTSTNLFIQNSGVNANRTGQEEVVNLIGQANYDESRTPCQNFVRFLLNRGQLPTANIISIRGWEFSFENERCNQLKLPSNIKLENCQLVSANSHLHFYKGDLTITGFNSVGLGDGENVEVNANADHSYARVKNGGTAHANVAGSKACVHSSDLGRLPATANANAIGAIAETYDRNGIINATVLGAITISYEEYQRQRQASHPRHAIENQMGNHVEFDDEEVQQVMDNSLIFQLQHNANQISGGYNAQGGIQEVFARQIPGKAQILEINSCIQGNIAELTSNDGMKAGDVTIFLPEGRDCIGMDDFDFSSETEWCLLNQGNKTYNLVTTQTAESLISSGSRHPFIQRQLEVGDIVRGKAVLDLLSTNGAERNIGLTHHTGAITENPTCTLF